MRWPIQGIDQESRQPDANGVGTCRLATGKYSKNISIFCRSYQMPSLWSREKGRIIFWNACVSRVSNHQWCTMSESLSVFSIIKACSRTKFTEDLNHNSRMTRTVSVAFNSRLGRFSKGEKICTMKNDQVACCFDWSNRLSLLVLIANDFVRDTQLLRPVTFHTRLCLAYEICLTWKPFTFEGSRTCWLTISVNDILQFARGHFLC
jgi:hypothetical protein